LTQSRPSVTLPAAFGAKTSPRVARAQESYGEAAAPTA